MDDTEFLTHADRVTSTHQRLQWISSVLNKLTPVEITEILQAVEDIETQVADMLYGAQLDFEHNSAYMATEVSEALKEHELVPSF